MPEIDINELAMQMGVPRRTIRYYVEIGLLAPPLGAGRAATYGDEHLAQLQAIRRLQAQGLTLDQIRDALAPASEAAESTVGEARAEPAPPVAPEPSAASYLAEVRQRLGASTPRSARYQVPAFVKPSASPDWQAESWMRVRIDRDVELHVRRMSSRRVARLVKELRRVLAEDSERTT